MVTGKEQRAGGLLAWVRAAQGHRGIAKAIPGPHPAKFRESVPEQSRTNEGEQVSLSVSSVRQTMSIYRKNENETNETSNLKATEEEELFTQTSQTGIGSNHLQVIEIQDQGLPDIVNLTLNININPCENSKGDFYKIMVNYFC